MSSSERIDDDIWGSILGGYRSGHHLDASVAWVDGMWNIKSAGDLQDVERASGGISYSFRYTYHISIVEGAGYFVGTAFEYFDSDADLSSDFSEGDSFRIPSFVVGVSFTPISRLMFTAGTDFSMGRFSVISYPYTTDGITEDRDIGISMTGFKTYVGAYAFYNPGSAIFFEFQTENMKYTKPFNIKAAENLALDVKLSRRQNRFILGYSYHLLSD